jgi:outer membrane protein assembly factor BamD (BamD/ComL family)
MRNLLAFAFALAAVSPLSAQDIIKFKDPAKNPDLEGDITSMSCKVVEIEVTVAGARIKRSADPREIAEIVPSNTKKTLDFVRGEEALINRDFLAAIQRFERVVSDTRADELLRQSAAILIVRCHASSGNHAGVIQTTKALLTQKPDSFYFLEASELRVKAQLAARELAAAAAAIKALAALGLAQAMPEWIRTADLLEAGLAELQGNWRGALAIYKKHARDPETADDAALGELRCSTALADWAGLRGRADAVIKESRGRKTFNPRLLVAAYTGRGDSEMNGGKAKEALLEYLQGALVQSKGETSPEHEASLARSSIACAKVALAESDRAKKDTYRGRAQELLRELTSTYPGSRFKAEVERVLRELR